MIGLNPVSDGFKILSMTFLLTFCGGRCFLSIKDLLKKIVANILKYEFCKMHLRPVEHFFPPFFSRPAVDLERNGGKSVQLVRGPSFRGDFLQNPNFS